MRKYALRFNMKQHIIVANAHYSNGSIEMIKKIYLQLMRALLLNQHNPSTMTKTNSTHMQCESNVNDSAVDI